MHVHVPSRNISRLRQLGEPMTEPQASQGAEQAAHLEVGAPTEAEPKGSPGLCLCYDWIGLREKSSYIGWISWIC